VDAFLTACLVQSVRREREIMRLIERTGAAPMALHRRAAHRLDNLWAFPLRASAADPRLTSLEAAQRQTGARR
jgi:hypothetical protein